jgi:acetoin utilization deacetylase AcuC-like enzyme
MITADGMVRDDTIVRPEEATENDLRKVHTEAYIKSLKVG